MSNQFQDGMLEAKRLTNEGRLAEATAVIQHRHAILSAATRQSLLVRSQHRSLAQLSPLQAKRKTRMNTSNGLRLCNNRAATRRGLCKTPTLDSFSAPPLIWR